MRYRVKDPEKRRALEILGLPAEFDETAVDWVYNADSVGDTIIVDIYEEVEVEPVEPANELEDGDNRREDH